MHLLNLLFLLPISLTGIASLNLKTNQKSLQTRVSVPTTLNLNDVSEANIRDYYSSLNSLSEDELKGTNLLKNLKPILKSGQQCYSYGSSATTQVWQAYEIIDRDWKLSPASEMKGYDAATNTVTGYKYGTSASSAGSNPYIHALYVNRNAKNETKAWGDHSQTNYGINQEHVWPKSLGFDDDSKAEGARGDLMHLWAGNGKVNGAYHKNYFYGKVDKSRTYKDAGEDYSYLSGNLVGYSKTFGGTTYVFEPQDSDKGDIARIMFYMMARYNNLAGGDEIDASNPNLEIVNNITDFSNSGYTSTTSRTGKNGILQDLLEWNKQDPVDYFEIHRNNLLFNNFSFNRNPFIDFPEWADYIWGTSTNGTYNSNPTGRANPVTDNIAPGDEEPIIPPDPDTDDKGSGFDWYWIVAAIAAGNVFVILGVIGVALLILIIVVVLVIVFVNLSKKNKKKVIKTATKAIKKSTKSSSSKKKK